MFRSLYVAVAAIACLLMLVVATAVVNQLDQGHAQAKSPPQGRGLDQYQSRTLFSGSYVLAVKASGWDDVEKPLAAWQPCGDGLLYRSPGVMDWSYFKPPQGAWINVYARPPKPSSDVHLKAELDDLRKRLEEFNNKGSGSE